MNWKEVVSKAQKRIRYRIPVQNPNCKKLKHGFLM